MDLGIRGRKALVCAASKGLGRACALSLAQEGVEVTIVARTPGPLEQAAEEIRAAPGVAVNAVATDITTVEGRRLALEACPQPDILVNNAGGSPPGDFRDWRRDARSDERRVGDGCVSTCRSRWSPSHSNNK